jgi:hypothetical protein
LTLDIEVRQTGDPSAPWGIFVGTKAQPVMKSLTQMGASLLKAAFVAGYFHKLETERG